MKLYAQENALIRAAYRNDFFGPYRGREGDDGMSSPPIYRFDETAHPASGELPDRGDAVPPRAEREPHLMQPHARTTRSASESFGMVEHATTSGRPRNRVLNSVKTNGRWLPLDVAGLASSVISEKQNPSPMGKAAIASNALFLGGSLTHIANLHDLRPLAQASRAMTFAGMGVGTGLDIAQLVSDAKDLKANPNDEQAKWNVGNSAARLGLGIGAAAAAVFCPPAALVPLLVPDFAQIHQAISLRRQETDLRAQGRDVEADAIHAEYQLAALNSTPLVNLFAPVYTHRMQPEVMAFEASQGNKPGGAPMGDIPPDAIGSKAVLQYYGQALDQRARAFGEGALPSLKKAAQEAGADSVTAIIHAPQQFDWPGSNGAPMRIFDRAIIATYSAKTDSMHAEFFGKDKGGVFRLPYLNQGTDLGGRSKNIVVVNRSASDQAPVKFDLDAYTNDRTGSVILVDPDRSVV
nr:hypothetical protein HUO10_006351 [Paraburkholderia busanensis]